MGEGDKGRGEVVLVLEEQRTAVDRGETDVANKQMLVYKGKIGLFPFHCVLIWLRYEDKRSAAKVLFSMTFSQNIAFKIYIISSLKEEVETDSDSIHHAYPHHSSLAFGDH
ncbi:hypothetical protein STEG23_022205 [Scotinomys teguina]